MTNPDEIVRGLEGDIEEDWGEGIFGWVEGKGMVGWGGRKGKGPGGGCNGSKFMAEERGRTWFPKNCGRKRVAIGLTLMGEGRGTNKVCVTGIKSSFPLTYNLNYYFQQGLCSSIFFFLSLNLFFVSYLAPYSSI